MNKYLLIIFLLFAYSCAVPQALKPKKVDPNTPVNADERARKNIEEGRGISIKGVMDRNKGTTFQFSSSNPLWRASLETIDFMSLSSVDYAGGLIITDWYSEGSSTEAVKITITFLSNEIRSDGLIIDVRKRNCNQNNQCVVKKIESDLNIKIKDKILRRAAVLDKDLKAKIKKKRPKKLYPDD